MDFMTNIAKHPNYEGDFRAIYVSELSNSTHEFHTAGTQNVPST